MRRHLHQMVIWYTIVVPKRVRRALLHCEGIHAGNLAAEQVRTCAHPVDKLGVWHQVVTVMFTASTPSDRNLL